MKALEGMSNHLDLLSEFDNVAQAETTLLSKII